MTESRELHHRIVLRAIACASLALFGASGYAGGFHTDENFQRYVALLDLSDMSMTNAANRLQKDGFKCWANND